MEKEFDDTLLKLAQLIERSSRITQTHDARITLLEERLAAIISVLKKNGLLE